MVTPLGPQQNVAITAGTPTRRHVLRLAGVAVGATATACSVGERGAQGPSATTTSAATTALDLPYLFEHDQQAQQISRRLSATTPSTEELRMHEQFMRLAIDVSTGNPSRPFGAVIVNHTTGEVLGQGVNKRLENPTVHGEVAAINDYIARHGNTGWDRVTLYSTGEPCVLCCGALILVGIPRVVWASSIATILRSGIPQIEISAIEVIARAHQNYNPELVLGGVLAKEMDTHFANRER